MSGHNPHGHLSQPNSSWNPLQIPSYIPRQPQLAHMSNERPLVRSPLTWHTPTPPDALYSFISANHKNLELNPMIPSFVRGPSPFGSVDLTIQSARNSTTPSPRSLTSPPPEIGHNKQISRSLTPNSLSNSIIGPSPGVIQSTASVREKFQNSNGNNGELSAPTTGSLFIRDARQINTELAKMTTSREQIEMPPSAPVGLIKEMSYPPIKSHAVPTSTIETSQGRPPSAPNNMSTSPKSPSPTPTALRPLSTATLLPSTLVDPVPHSNINSSSGNGNLQSNVKNSDVNTTNVLENSNYTTSILPSPVNTTSNDDSVDSSTSKTRRKRKPNKTTKILNDSSDDSSSTTTPKEGHEISPSESLSNDISKNSTDKKENTLLPDDRRNKAINKSETNDIPDSHEKTDMSSENTLLPATKIVPESISIAQNTISAGTLSNNQNLTNHQKSSEKNKIDLDEGNGGVIVNNTVTKEDSSLTTVSQVEKINHSSDMIASKCHSKYSDGSLDKSDLKNSENSSSEFSDLNSPRRRMKRKGDSDDVETIDKIAAMIASGSNETESNVGKQENNIDHFEGMDKGKIEAQNNNRKITDLAEILTSSSTTVVSNSLSIIDPIVDHSKESCFEEVENKLEEMFAGIEDERPLPCIDSTTTGAAGDSEVISDLGLEISTTNIKNETISEDQQKSSADVLSQKRTHSIKLEPTAPPKKKRKVVKKSNVSGNGNAGSSNSKASNNCSRSKHNKGNKNNEKTSSLAKDKVKDEVNSGYNGSSDIKYKGPFIQVKLDGSVNVVNAPIAEDDNEKQNKVKKAIHNHSKSDRSKFRGLHVSTLSMKYDADTTDATWMCVFCKRGPHKLGLGDLFGPYVITTTCEEYELSQKDPLVDEFVSKRVKTEMYQKHVNRLPAVPAANTVLNITTPSTSATKKKRKTNDSPSAHCSAKLAQQNTFDINEIYVGMVKASETSYEVWIHEDCAVWSAGVHIIGARIVGLEAAVWSSTRHRCSICSDNGAMICCLQRGCSEKAHIACAKMKNWTLIEPEFKSLCENHSASLSIL